MSEKEIIPNIPGTELSLTDAQLLTQFNQDKDFDLVENNLKRYVEDMQHQVSTLANLADQSQNPRAYEVLHNFYKVMIEGNRELVETKRKKSELIAAEMQRKNPNNLGSGGNIQNNVFVGSTAELQRLFLKNNMKEIDGN